MVPLSPETLAEDSLLPLLAASGCLEILDVPWLLVTSLQSLLASSLGLPLCVCLVTLNAE